VVSVPIRIILPMLGVIGGLGPVLVRVIMSVALLSELVEVMGRKDG